MYILTDGKWEWGNPLHITPPRSGSNIHPIMILASSPVKEDISHVVMLPMVTFQHIPDADDKHSAVMIHNGVDDIIGFHLRHPLFANLPFQLSPRSTRYVGPGKISSIVV